MSFQFRSFQQIAADGIRKFKARAGIDDFRPGSVIATFIEAMATEDFQQYYQMLQTIRSYNLDTTEGDDLEERALEITGQGRIEAVRATGFVTVEDSGFEKVSTKIYAGLAGPVSGQNFIYVNDASTGFPASGDIIIGRGTDNVETISYTSIVNLTNFFKINLSSTLLNDHGTDETVILSQGGNRDIPAGALVKVPLTDQSFEVLFSIDSDTVLLDGEDELELVAVTAVEAGEDGNVASRAITQFDSPPFPGATVTNPSAFTNARGEETDSEMRDRIKTFIQTLSRGTPLSVTQAAIGIVDPDENKRVVSANFIDTTNLDDIPILYIDDGTGFEPSFDGIGNEVIVDSATGGEQFLQLEQFPLVKAQVETLNAEPFAIVSGDTLTVAVEGLEETITFSNADFEVPQAGTAEEVVTSINDRMTTIEARTSQIGKQIVIRAKAQQNENIRVVGGTANTSSKLNFPTNLSTTLLLYKISAGSLTLLSKDGVTATLESGAPSPTIDITQKYHLKYKVDGRIEVEVDLRPTSLGGDYSGTYNFNTDVTLAELVNAINDTSPGITAVLTSSNTRITLISNTERSSGSKIQILAASSNDINDDLNFSLTEVVGKDSDYTLNRFNGQIELNEPLVAGDIVTAGSINTRGFLTGTIVGPFNLESGGLDDITFSVDGAANQTVAWNPADFTNITQATPQEVVDVLNRDVKGITALVNSNDTITIRTNYWDNGIGSIEVISSNGNGNAMGFLEGSQIDSIDSHTPFLVSGNSENYIFNEDDLLIVVLDNDAQNKTFSITMDLDAEITVGDNVAPYTSFSGIISSSGQDIGVKFTGDQDIKNARIIFKSGENFESSDTIQVGTDPDPDAGGSTSIEVAIDPNDDALTVAAKTSIAINALANFSTSVLGNTVTVTNAADGVTTDSTPGTSGFTINTLQQGVNPIAEETEVVCAPKAFKEQTQVTVPAAAALDPVGTGLYWNLFSANDITQYYVWYRVTDGNVQSDPTPGGVGVQVDILAADSDIVVAQKTSSALNILADFESVIPPSATLTVTNANFGNTTDATDATAGVSIAIAQQGVTGIEDGQYFNINSAEDVTEYYVYYDTTGNNLNDPAPAGRTGIRVDISSAPSASDVANLTALTIDISADFIASDVGTTVTVINANTGVTTDAVNINVGGASVTVTVQGAGLEEVTSITTAADSNGNLNNKYFFIYSAGDATKYYVWYHVNGDQSSTTFFRANTDVGIKFPNDIDLTNFSTRIRWISGDNEGEERLVNFYNASEGFINLNSALPNPITIGDQFEVRLEDVVDQYDASVNLITLSTGVPNQISNSDEFIIIPRTASNVATFINNTTVTTFSVEGRADAVNNGTKVQLESKTIGGSGVVNVTGGSANDVLAFDTTPLSGKDGYQYFTGLLRRVQRTIDGLDSNLTEFPGIKAGGIQIEVAAPTVRNVQVILTVTLSGLSVGAVSNDIKSEINNYINSLGIGDSIIKEKIAEAVLKVTGVTDVLIQEPSVNIPIADNEIGRTSDSFIIISASNN